MSEDDRRDYDVGYGKPPREHQFRKGTSGNPNGRKRSKLTATSRKSLPERTYEIAQELITATVNGQVTKMTKQDMLVHRLFQQAAKGSVRHVIQVLELIEEGRDVKDRTVLPEDMDRLRKDPLAAQRAYHRMLGILK